MINRAWIGIGFLTGGIGAGGQGDSRGRVWVGGFDGRVGAGVFRLPMKLRP